MLLKYWHSLQVPLLQAPGEDPDEFVDQEPGMSTLLTTFEGGVLSTSYLHDSFASFVVSHVTVLVLTFSVMATTMWQSSRTTKNIVLIPSLL